MDNPLIEILRLCSRYLDYNRTHVSVQPHRAHSEAVGVSLVNLSIMKNNRAKAIRYSTLTAICHVLGCQPGELLSVERARRVTRRVAVLFINTRRGSGNHETNALADICPSSTETVRQV